MDKIIVEREAIVLDTSEKRQLAQCLKYCRHRYNEHPNSGIHYCVSLKFITYMLEAL